MRSILLGLALLAATSWTAHAETLRGPATVIDGDTLEVAGTMLRLEGIDAPELDQTCQKNGKDNPCGVIARDALLDLVTAVEVVCRTREDAGEPPVLAHCAADGFDVGANMIYTGWALPVPGWAAYDNMKADAIKDGRGLWSMTFVEPWAWRAATP